MTLVGVKLEVRPLGFFSTVRLLLRVARARATGREKCQRELLRQRKAGVGGDWRLLGFLAAVFAMLVVNGMAAFIVSVAVEAGERIQGQRQGAMYVSREFYNAVSREESNPGDPEIPREERLGRLDYSSEASRISDRFGGSDNAIEQHLRDEVGRNGARNLVPAGSSSLFSITSALQSHSVPALLGSLVLLWWAVMLISQGEGLELDIQRRRYPMWEFLFAHPAPRGAVFLAEILSPIAANPMYWGGPIFAAILFTMAYDASIGLLAAALIGVPVTIALAAAGKAAEIGVMLRFPVRTRGAIIGLMSWLGYASMMLFFFGFSLLPKVFSSFSRSLASLAAFPWPWLGWFLGWRSDGTYSFPLAIAACWLFTIVIIALAVGFSMWGAQQGLAGNFAAETRPARTGRTRFGREPLYRKEFLWFIRDRSAIVQTILIPITVAGAQIFNLHGVLGYAEGAWNYLCGAAILFGTYFLWILGPKSLLSEGNALWIALTWPRGLESLLKAKAWLWSLISTGMVMLILGYTAFLFPPESWKIALVAVGWYLFSRSMADKTVTLVTVTSQSGEPEKIPAGRRWAAELGMLTFAIGVLTRQWNLVVVGIVYSHLTAAAMWQNFRARLPYLYDQWSEKLPPAPTLMHAMVAVSIMVEGAAIMAGVLVVVLGRDSVAVAQAVSYAIAAAAVAIGVCVFLDGRGVSLRDVWHWPAENAPSSWRISPILLGVAGGVVLGALALVYTTALQHIPETAEILRKANEAMASIPHFRLCYGIMAIAIAPFAEEYLFRGLLYRALDREWGRWEAVVGSAAFFAIYHPALLWLPVFTLGAINCLLFKKTGRLLPAVALHMVYNAIVILWQ